MMFPFVDNDTVENEQTYYTPREYGMNFETGQLTGVKSLGLSGLTDGREKILHLQLGVWTRLGKPYRKRILKRLHGYRGRTDGAGVPDGESLYYRY